MNSTVSRSRKRLFAAAMLLVWIFSLGSAIASTCMMGDARSGPSQREHHAATVATLTRVMAADAHRACVHDPDGAVDGWSHRVHCQPIQATERSRPPRQQIDKKLDLVTIVSAAVNWPVIAGATNHWFRSRLHRAPASAGPPLFIRLRRLIP